MIRGAGSSSTKGSHPLVRVEYLIDLGWVRFDDDVQPKRFMEPASIGGVDRLTRQARPQVVHGGCEVLKVDPRSDDHRGVEDQGGDRSVGVEGRVVFVEESPAQTPGSPSRRAVRVSGVVVAAIGGPPSPCQRLSVN